jgi:hypothetical protein
MSTLWDATPRVWAVEGFSSAVSSHKKQYLLGQSIVRSHIQTFFRSPPEVPRFGQRNRKIFWINVIHELNRMERNMNDIGDLTADYRALVLFRINLSTLSTLRPQIELGCEGLRKGCRCLVTGLYSMKKLFYTLDEFIYVVVLCSRSFQQFPECRRSTEGSTEGHYTDWALAHHIGKAMRSRMFDVVQEKLSKHGGRYAREDLEAQK